MQTFKEQKREEARKALTAKGIVFQSFNDDYHWKIGTVNFYPTTGLFRDEANDHQDSGYKALIKYLNPKPKSVKQLTVEQIFDIAKRSKDRSLEGICEAIHKGIYSK